MMRPDQVQRLIEQRREELLAQRGAAFDRVRRAAQAVTHAAREIKWADDVLRSEGFDVAPVCLDDLPREMYSDPPFPLPPKVQRLVDEAMKENN